MNDRLEVTITDTSIYQSVKVGAVVLGDEVFSAYLCSYNFRKWHLRLVLEPNSDCDGCDVEELDEDTAIQILGSLFNVHIYHEKSGVSRF